MRSSPGLLWHFPLWAAAFVFSLPPVHAAEPRGLPDRMGHFGTVSGIAYSPDGNTLATSSWDGSVRLWKLGTFGSKSRELKGHRGQVLCVAFSPDGKTVASGGADETIRIWNVADGSQAAVITAGRGNVYSLAFSPDGKTLASAEFSFTARLWDVARKKQAVHFAGHRDRVNSIAFSPDGKTVVTGCYDKKVRLFSAANGDELWSAAAGNDVYSVAISPDGKTVAAAARDNLVQLWGPKGEPKGTIPIEGRDWAHVVAFGRDGALAFGTRDGIAQLWDVSYLARRYHILRKQGRAWARETIWSMAFSPDGKQAAVGVGSRVERFEISGGMLRAVLPRPAEVLAVARDGRLATAGGETIVLGSPRPGDKQVELKGHTGSVSSLAFSRNGTVLVSGGFDKTVRLWDVAAGTQRTILKDYPGGVWSVAISADGSRVAAGGWATGKPGSAVVWDVATGKAMKVFTLTAEHVRGVALSPDGALLAAAAGRPGERGEFKAWEVVTGKELATRKRDRSAFTAVAFAADGTTVAVGAYDGVELLGPRNGTTRMLLKDKDDSRAPGVDFIAFSPDGKTLLTGGKNYDRSQVRLWDLASGRRRLDVVSSWESLEIASAAFSPDGKLVFTGASGGHKNELRVWDISAEAIRFRLKAGAASMALGASGKRLLVGGTSSNRPDGVRLFDLTAPRDPVVITPGKEFVANPVALTPDGALAAYSFASFDKKDQPTAVVLWDVAARAEKARFDGHKGGVLRLAFNGTGTRLASIGYDGELILWEVPGGKLLYRVAAHKGVASALAFSADGKLLVSGGDDGKARVWDVSTGKAKGTFDAGSRVRGASISPDSKAVAAACRNGKALLWPIAGGEPIRITVHSSDAEALAFSPDGRLLVVGTAVSERPGLVRVFGAVDGKPLGDLSGHNSGVTTVLFSADGKTLACGGYGNEITFWDASRLVPPAKREAPTPATKPAAPPVATPPAADDAPARGGPALPGWAWLAGAAVVIAGFLGLVLWRPGRRAGDASP